MSSISIVLLPSPASGRRKLDVQPLIVKRLLSTCLIVTFLEDVQKPEG